MFVQGTHDSPVDAQNKVAIMLSGHSLLLAWIIFWANRQVAIEIETSWAPFY